MGLLFVCGCFQSHPSPPAFVPPRETIEIFATSATANANTKTATNPSSGATIHLVNPPIVTNSDILGVARSEIAIDIVGGAASTTPTLELKLNAAGTPKMLTATTNPVSPSIAFVLNGNVIAVAHIHSPINGSFSMTGDQAFINAIDSITGQTN